MQPSNHRRRLLMLAAGAAVPDAPPRQDPTGVQPDNYRVVLDNAQVRVLDYRARPGMGMCGTGLHSHPAHLTVTLTPARVRVKQDGKTQVVELPAGAVFWSDGEVHETENLTGTEARALIVELKKA